MDRVTVEDQLVLWPDQRWPQDVGAVVLLDGAGMLEEAGRFRIEAVRAAVAGRLHLVPRFRQLLHTPRRGLGRPVWVDDPAFDLAAHVQESEVPAPGDDAALLREVERLRRRRLDRSRPLWKMWFLPGLAERRVGVFVRFHHVLADGIAGVATMAAFLDAVPGAAATPAPLWTPAAAPTSRDLLLDRLRYSAARVRRAGAVLRSPGDAVRRVRSAWPAVRELVVDDRVQPTSLDRLVGAERRLGLLRCGLDEVRAVAHAHGATVNDVLLCLVAGGLRALLRGRGEPDDVVVRVYVPVSLRAADQRATARGNLISQMVVPLPLGIPSPEARLERIVAETARRKARPRPSLGALFANRFVGPVVLALLRRNPVNVETADVPGPEQPVYLAGARVVEVFPVLNLIGNVPLGIGTLSYAGRLGVLAIADREAVPDLDVLVDGARAELRALTATLPPRVAAAGANTGGRDGP
ncbi:wax ester/triacylglycerol synthase family O-acyltransferase [Geodermatophilus sp. SYSU D00766]